MAHQAALDLMQSAWATRRDSLEATVPDRRAALTAAREDLTKVAAMLRDEGSAVSYAHALHLRAHVEMDLGHEHPALVVGG